MKRYAMYFVMLTIIFVLMAQIQTFADPVNVENLKKYDFNTTEGFSSQNSRAPKSAITFMIYLVFFVTISILAYFTTRWIGKHQMKFTVKSKYMEVIDSISLGGEKGIHIVKSPQGLMILGVTKEGVYLLEKLGAEEAALIREAEANHESYDKSFAVYLSNYVNKIKGNSEHTKYGDRDANK